MSQIKTIFKNMSWVMISQILVSILGFFWTILIARYLGVEKYGIIGFATSIVGIFSITLDLGVTSYIVRQIATDNGTAHKNLGNVFPLKCLLSIGTFVLLFIVLILMKYDELTITITLLFMINSIVQTIISTINGSFQAFEKMKYQGIGNTLLNVLLFIFIIISIYTDLGIMGITISYIIANVIGLIYEYYAFNKHIIKPKFEFDRTFCKNLIKSSIPFAITSILFTIYYSIDIVMLNSMVGSYATGLYNATFKLISVVTLFYGIYASVIFPVMSKLFKNDAELLIISYEKSIKYLMTIIIPIAIATVFYSTDIMTFIYGHKYDAGAPILVILIWTACLLFANGAGNTLLNASHKEVSVTKIYSIAAIFNVIMNFILIPYLSYIGAAITTVLSDILIFIIQKYTIHRLGYKPNNRLYYDLGKIILSSLILGIALYFLKLNMWVALPVGILIYFAVLIIFRTFKNDKDIINELLGKN